MEENQIHIPEGWELTSFGDKDLFRIIGSGIKHFFNEKEYYSTSSIDGNRILFAEQLITYKNRPSRANMQPIENSVWFAKMKNTFKILKATNREIEEVILSTGFSGIESSVVDNDYLMQILSSAEFNSQKNLLAEGSTQEAVNNSKIKEIKFLLPKNPKEQTQIATILSKVDKAIAQTEQLIAKYTRIKTGLMQDLLTKGINRNLTLMISDLKGIAINNQFKQCKFENITKVRQGFQISISKRKKEEGVNRYIYITVQYLNNPKKHLEFIENPPENVICSADEILFTRTGNTGQIVSGIKGVFHNNFFKVSFDDKEISRDYLMLYLNWEPVQDLIKELAGTTTIPDMKHKDFYGMPIFFPSTLTEQKKITDIINRSNQSIISYQNELNKLQSLKTGLMQDLLSGKVRVNHLIKETTSV